MKLINNNYHHASRYFKLKSPNWEFKYVYAETFMIVVGFGRDTMLKVGEIQNPTSQYLKDQYEN